MRGIWESLDMLVLRERERVRPSSKYSGPLLCCMIDLSDHVGEEEFWVGAEYGGVWMLSLWKQI
jgi:hypothetical protein